MAPPLKIRPATQDDVPEMNAINTHFINNTVINFALSPWPDSEISTRLSYITGELGLPWIVGTVDNNNNNNNNKGVEALAGIAYAGPFRWERAAYIHTAEITILLHPDYVGMGYGPMLMEALLKELRNYEPKQEGGQGDGMTGIKQVLAIMAVDVDGPGEGLGLKRWYERCGFVEAGDMKKVGWKFGRWVDVKIMQMSLN